VYPEDERFSGFVFKIQANLDPLHRDSVVFVRVCSGRFNRDMRATHVPTGRPLRLARGHRLCARDREPVDEAFPGDVVGLVNPGQMAIGDTLCAGGEHVFQFEEIPSFEPEHFAVLHNANTAKHKQFNAGLHQLAEESVIQVLRAVGAGPHGPILAAVPLQLDVVRYRLEAEYGPHTRLEALDYRRARWLEGSPEAVTALPWGRGALLARDRRGRPVGLFDSDFTVQWQLHHPDVGYREQPPS
jgi:peptide chain release factor 3